MAQLKNEQNIQEFIDLCQHVDPFSVSGTVVRCRGGSIIAQGLDGFVGIGDTCRIGHIRCNYREYHKEAPDGSDHDLLAEVVGFEERHVVLMPYAEIGGVTLGAPVRIDASLGAVHPSREWLGRVIDPLGVPLDGGQTLPSGARAYPLHARALPALSRRGLGPRLDLGVRALNLFTPCRVGQRLGIFAGSGVGKSTLLSMIARYSGADALVIGLIGERGREVGELLNEGLGDVGRERCVTVVATSDMPAMLRRRAAYLTLSIAERLRDDGLNVLCLMDSVTRFAMALREIGLAAGEPPTSKGYPPGVFAELPRLLERAGPGRGAGTITGLFTVFVEGDDTNDPIADAVRAILDGHVVLDRGIAESGRFPAVDVLRSLSRTAPGCYEPEERDLALHARRLLRAHDSMKELIQLGAYQAGSDPMIDAAIARMPALDAILTQGIDEAADLDDGQARLVAALAADVVPA